MTNNSLIECDLEMTWKFFKRKQLRIWFDFTEKLDNIIEKWKKDEKYMNCVQNYVINS